MANIYLPSTSDGKFWLVCEPPEDTVAMDEAIQELDSTTLEVAKTKSNRSLAMYLKSLSVDDVARATKADGTGPAPGGDTNLIDSIPGPLTNDVGFMNAFGAGDNLYFYQVDTNKASHYYLAAGGERGPGSTRFVLKLAPNGSMQQATWNGQGDFYKPMPPNTAEWLARRQISGTVITLTNSARVSVPGRSPFMPIWELQFNVDGTSVASIVTADADLSGDADGDGQADGDELYAGFDPDNPGSVFTVEGGSMEAIGDDKLVITWPSVAGKTYSVHRCTDIMSGFGMIDSGIAATAPQNSYTDTVTSATAYYKVEVE